MDRYAERSNRDSKVKHYVKNNADRWGYCTSICGNGYFYGVGNERDLAGKRLCKACDKKVSKYLPTVEKLVESYSVD